MDLEVFRRGPGGLHDLLQIIPQRNYGLGALLVRPPSRRVGAEPLPSAMTMRQRWWHGAISLSTNHPTRIKLDRVGNRAPLASKQNSPGAHNERACRTRTRPKNWPRGWVISRGLGKNFNPQWCTCITTRGSFASRRPHVFLILRDLTIKAVDRSN
jgi:hypothetical protein